MTKLEWEMKRQNLGFSRELHKFMIKTYENNLLASWVLVISSAILVIIMIICSVHYFKCGIWGICILDAVLAVADVWICMTNINDVKETKKKLVSKKAELECVDSEIQSLEGMVF